MNLERNIVRNCLLQYIRFLFLAQRPQSSHPPDFFFFETGGRNVRNVLASCITNDNNMVGHNCFSTKLRHKLDLHDASNTTKRCLNKQESPHWWFDIGQEHVFLQTLFFLCSFFYFDSTSINVLGGFCPSPTNGSPNNLSIVSQNLHFQTRKLLYWKKIGLDFNLLCFSCAQKEKILHI